MAGLTPCRDCSGRYEAAMSIPDFALLFGRKFLELLDTQAEPKSCKSNGSIAPILDPHGAVELVRVHRTKDANAVNLDLGNHGLLHAKRKAVTSKGRPIFCASSSVVAGGYITVIDEIRQYHHILF